MKLTNKDKDLYDQLKHEIFSLESLKNFSLAQQAKELKITYYKALLWYSHMLKFYADHKRPPADHFCPTCGKQKNEVTDTSKCRDVFHYL
jgi:Zn finger protein HypA/HybF involved in hydrogenase expression